MANAPAPLHFSRIGLGCATFGREIDETASFALMDDALARGITLFDTAAAYSAGASEHIVGAWLAKRRPPPGSLTIATKILPPYTPEAIAQAVAQSDARLGVRRIDLLYLHRWDETAASPVALQTLDAFVRKGDVGAIGVSNFNADQLHTVLAQQAALGLAPFRALQNNHNFAVRDLDSTLRELCALHGMAIVTYSPLGAGFLTGKHRQGVSEGTRFAIIPGHQRVYFHETAWRRLDRLERVAAQTGHPQTKLALAWAFRQPGVTSVLVGGRSPAHLAQAFAAVTFDDPLALAALGDDAA